MKRLMILLLLITNIYANNPPEPDYSKHLPLESEQDGGKKLVGDDALGQENFNYGITESHQLGESYIEKRKDEYGNVYYYNVTEEKRIDEFEYQKISKEFEEKMNNLNLKNLSTKEELEEQNRFIGELKKERNEEVERLGYTPKQYEDMFLKGEDSVGTGNSYVNSVWMVADEDDENYEDTMLYQKHNTFHQKDNSTATLKGGAEEEVPPAESEDGEEDEELKKKVSNLKKSYLFVETYKELLKSKTESPILKCYISRDLIPTYYCPMPGKENVLWGGSKLNSGAKVPSSGESKQSCEGECRKANSCVKYEILEDTKISFSESSGVLYPYTELKLETEELSNSMVVKEITFKVNVVIDDDLTDEEKDEIFKYVKMDVKYDVIQSNPKKDIPDLYILRGASFNINGAETLQKIFLYHQTEKLKIKFYKPNLKIAAEDEQVYLDRIKEIRINDLKAEYNEKNIYFCPFKQFVDNDTDCDLNGGGEIIKIKTNSQVYNLCTDVTHKIGPENMYGGFFNQSSCESSCYEEKDCLPSYRHYANASSDEMFKVTVGCVDSEDNSSCSVEKCEELLSTNKMPNNEWVIYNDDLRKQTVHNKVVSLDNVRPKYNLQDELSVNKSYEEIFQEEMKDGAYLSMVRNQTFNRVEKRIGTDIEKRNAFSLNVASGNYNLNWHLKPNAYDYDSNEEQNLYVVAELIEYYRPYSGVFNTGGWYEQVKPTKPTRIKFKDRSLFIKSPNASTGWKLFKKEDMFQINKLQSGLRCEGKVDVIKEYGYFKNREIPEECAVFEHETFAASPYMKSKNVFFDEAKGEFLNYSDSEKAEIYKSEKFSSDIIIYDYNISDNITYELEYAPGGIIRTQHQVNNGAWFGKNYINNFGELESRGFMENYKIYAFYDKEKLTYKELESKLVDKNLIYDKLNSYYMAKSIKSDGEIKNNIELFLMGRPNNTTVNMKTTPYLKEEGQRVFKFVLLYKDAFEQRTLSNQLEEK